MPWYVEKDEGQARKRVVQHCFLPHYGEDVSMAERLARKRSRKDGIAYCAVYLKEPEPEPKKEEPASRPKPRQPTKAALLIGMAVTLMPSEITRRRDG